MILPPRKLLLNLFQVNTSMKLLVLKPSSQRIHSQDNMKLLYLLVPQSLRKHFLDHSSTKLPQSLDLLLLLLHLYQDSLKHPRMSNLLSFHLSILLPHQRSQPLCQDNSKLVNLLRTQQSPPLCLLSLESIRISSNNKLKLLPPLLLLPRKTHQVFPPQHSSLHQIFPQYLLPPSSKEPLNLPNLLS